MDARGERSCDVSTFVHPSWIGAPSCALLRGETRGCAGASGVGLGMGRERGTEGESVRGESPGGVGCELSVSVCVLVESL
jgi:hypothetical protein